MRLTLVLSAVLCLCGVANAGPSYPPPPGDGWRWVDSAGRWERELTPPLAPVYLLPSWAGNAPDCQACSVCVPAPVPAHAVTPPYPMPLPQGHVLGPTPSVFPLVIPADVRRLVEGVPRLGGPACPDGKCPKR